MTAGEHIRAAREAAGMTIVQLAEMADITWHSLWMIEAGRNKPRLTTAILLADALEISIDELVGHKVHKRERYMG